MDNKKQATFTADIDMFYDLLEEYDFRMTIAKDEIISFVLLQFAKYLKETYQKIDDCGGSFQIVLEKDNEYAHIIPALYVEKVNATNCTYIDMENEDGLMLQDLKYLRIFIEEDTDEAFYELIFDSDIDFLIIQCKDSMLVYDHYENDIMINTFLDVEVDAILYTLSFIISCLMHNKKPKTECTIIDLSEFKKRKNQLNDC